MSAGLDNQGFESLGSNPDRSQANDHPMMDYTHEKARLSGVRETGISGPEVWRCELASDRSRAGSFRLTYDPSAPKQEIYDPSFLTEMPTSAPLCRQDPTELLHATEYDPGRSSLRQKNAGHRMSANDPCHSIAEQSGSVNDRRASFLPTDIVSPPVKAILSSSRPKSLNSDKPLPALPQRKSLNLNGPFLTIPNSDSIQISPTHTSSLHRVSDSSSKSLEDASVDTRNTDWSLHNTSWKPNNQIESPLNNSPSTIVPTRQVEILASTVLAEDQRRLEEPRCDNFSVTTFTPSAESLASDAVSPISPTSRFLFSTSSMYPPTKSNARYISPASNVASPVPVEREGLSLGTLEPHDDIASGWIPGSPLRLESGKQEREHMRSDNYTHDTATPSHSPVSYGVVSGIPGAHWTTDSGSTQPSLPTKEVLDLAWPLPWSIIDEFPELESPLSMTKPITTQSDVSKPWSTAFSHSLAFPTPLVRDTSKDLSSIDESIETLGLEISVPTSSPIETNNDDQRLYKMPYQADGSDQGSVSTSPWSRRQLPALSLSCSGNDFSSIGDKSDNGLSSSLGVGKTPRCLTPSRLLISGPSKEGKRKDGCIAVSENGIAPVPQCRSHLSGAHSLSISTESLQHCFEHGSLLVTNSPTKQILVEELRNLVSVVNRHWMQNLVSVPRLWARCSALSLDTLFKDSIGMLRKCFCGRGKLSQTFEELFVFVNLAIAAAVFIHYQQGFYCWNTLYNDALQWQHALSSDEDKAMFSEAMSLELWPGRSLYSTRSANLFDITSREPPFYGDHTSWSDALKSCELLKVCIAFLEGMSMSMSFDTLSGDFDGLIGFEEAGISERNTGCPPEALIFHPQDRPFKVQEMISAITQPLQHEPGIEALRRIVIDTELRIDQRLLREVREVEVTLATSSRVSSKSYPLYTTPSADDYSVELRVS